MNQGGEQGHDDYGLPPVDIEIPDDARELYRDIQAYHRELRALRRHERSMRWRAPFRRSGVALPLLAGCLIAALVAVMVSAMFTANPYLNGRTTTNSSGAGSPSANRSSRALASSGASTASPSTSLNPSPNPESSTSRLPGKPISVSGKQVRLNTLSSTALVIVPAHCGCAGAVRQLLQQATTAGVILYLVVPRGTSLASLDKLLATTARRTKVATDSDNVLTAAYPVGLTVLLVDAHGTVTVRERLGPKIMLEKQFMLLRPNR